jgi:uncharacterized protein (TIGR00299 family) protein
MLLGACVDAGLPVETLRAGLASLGLDNIRLDVARVRRCGLEATKVTVRDTTAPDAATAAPGGSHHDDAGDASHPRRPDRHRHLRHILELIERSTLSAAVKRKSAVLFERLASAEAAVHGIPIERVHFHEVGAIDSIADIVGTVFALHWFGADRTVASPLNTGSGTVRCEHGVLPVPAPATARLLSGVPIYADGPAVELLTPTGALLVTGHADAFGPLPPMAIERIGYGAGERDFPDRPNVVRLVVGTAVEARSGATAAPAPQRPERLAVLECELDDLSPQVIGALMTRLLDRGARDVYYTPVQMKKNRPGTLVTVLASPSDADRLTDILFSETTTLGVRTVDATRETLERRFESVATPYGEVRIKIGSRRGRVVSAAPEFEDCLRLAEAGGVPVKEVMASATQVWRTSTRQDQ